MQKPHTCTPLGTEAYPLEFEVDTLVTYIKVKESVADHLAVERFETEGAYRPGRDVPL